MRGKNTTPYKGSIHFKQLVTVPNTSLFLLLEHFTKATDSPRPFTNSNTRERRDLAKVTKPACARARNRSRTLLFLFLLWPLDLSGLSKLWAAGVCMWQTSASLTSTDKVSLPFNREFFLL